MSKTFTNKELFGDLREAVPSGTFGSKKSGGGAVTPLPRVIPNKPKKKKPIFFKPIRPIKKKPIPFKPLPTNPGAKFRKFSPAPKRPAPTSPVKRNAPRPVPVFAAPARSASPSRAHAGGFRGVAPSAVRNPVAPPRARAVRKFR